MKHSLALAALALAFGTHSASAQSTATYRLEFTALWSPATHPGAYPGGAHFSPLIGGTHSATGEFWEAGGLASNGMESMAESGSPTTLRNEILAAINSGTAGVVIQGPAISSPGGTTTTFTASAAFPLATVVTMVAPSPDWFIGSESINLRPGGNWAHEITIDLFGWDAGTDNGTNFNSSNSNTNPAVPITLQTSGPFFGTSPIGRFTFTRLSPGAEYCNGDGGNQLGCTDCPCSNEAAPGTIGGCLNSASRSARLLCEGAASVSSDTLRFEMTGAPGSAFAVLVSGNNLAPNNSNNPCFGFGSGLQSLEFDGLRCAVGSIRRHGGRAANALGEVGTTGPGWGTPNNPQVGLIAQGGFSSGQTRYFQAIYREDSMAGCGRGLNTSQAVGTTFTR